MLGELWEDGGGSIKVKADDEVGLDGVVDELCAGPYFCGAVEEAGVAEVGGALRGDRLKLIPDEGDACADVAEEGGEELCGAEGHGAFADDGFIPDVFALLDVGKVSADVAGVDGDVEALKWEGARGGEGGESLPIKDRTGCGLVGRCKTQEVVADFGVFLIGVEVTPAAASNAVHTGSAAMDQNRDTPS